MANTEEWNGTAWTELADVNRAYVAQGGAGSIHLLYVLVVRTGSKTTATEQWTANVPIGAWATSADMNNSNFGMGGDGTVTTAIASGGANTS